MLTAASPPASSSCGRSEATSPTTTSAAGRLRNVDVDQFPFHPERAARQIAARPASAIRRSPGVPSVQRRRFAFDECSEQPGDDHDGIHRRAAVTDPQLQVGAEFAGRTSKYIMPTSVITPVATRSATNSSYSAAVATGGTKPVVGHHYHRQHARTGIAGVRAIGQER